MAQTATSQIIEPALLEPVYRVIEKMYEQRVMVTKKVPKGDIPINTRGTRVSMLVYPSASFGGYLEGGNLAAGDTQYFIETKVYPARLNSGYPFTGTWYREVRGETSLQKGLATFLAYHQDDFLKKFEQAFCGTVTGELGVVVSSNNSTTVTFATTYAQGSTWSNRKFIPKARIQFYSSTGTQRQSGISSPFTCTVSLTTPPVPSSGLTTFDQVPTSGLTAGDIGVFEGSYNNYPTGIRDAVNNTGTFQTVARSSFPTALNADFENAGGATLSVTRLEKHKAGLMYRIQEPIKLGILTSYTQPEKFKTQGYTMIRYPEVGGTFKQDWDKTGFHDWEWDCSTDIEDDRLYGMKWDDIMRLDLKSFGAYDEDGLPWRLNFTGASPSAASDSFIGWYGWEGNFAWKRIISFFGISNLDTTSAPTGAGSLNY